VPKKWLKFKWNNNMSDLDPQILKELNDHFRYMREGVAEATTSTKTFAEGMTEAAKAEQEAAAITKASKANMEKATNEAIRSMASFGKALTSGAEGGFSKFSSGMESASGAVASLANNFGLLGKVFGGIVQVGTKVITMQLKQADDALKASDEIKKLGNAGALSTKQVMDMVHGAGLSAAEAGKLTNAMKKAGSGVIGLGDKFGDGAVAFGKMVAVTNEQREGFQRLGISQEELMGYQGDYLALQKASGMQMSKQGKSGEALQKASLDYTRNLVELSNISGNDLATTQQNIKAEKERYEYVLANTMQQREIDRANASGDTARAKQLTEEMEARDKLIKSTSQYLSESDKAGLAMFLTTGSYTEASAKFATAGVDMEGFREKIKAGKDVTAEFQQAMKDATGRQVDQLGTAALYNASLRDSTLLNTKNLQTLNARIGIDEAQFKKDAEAKALALQNGTKADTAENARNIATTAAIVTTVAFDKIVQATNPLISGFNDGLGAATLALTALALASTAALAGKAMGGAAAGAAGAVGGAGKLATGAGVLAAGAGGFAFGTMLNDTFKISDKIVDVLMSSTDKKIEESIKGAPAKVAAEPIAMGNEGRRTPGAPTAATAPVAMGNEGNRTARKSATLTPQPPEGAGAVEATKTISLGSILKFGTGSGTQQNFEGLTPAIKEAVIAAATEYNAATGSKFMINSAKRDPEDQKRLWDESVAAGRPGKGPTGMAIGKPGKSLHERGEAVDIQNYKDPAAVAALNKQGLSQKVPGDPVHFQARNGGVVDGPMSGYPMAATFHGNEAIIPLNPESIITKLLNTSEAQLNKEMNNNTTNNTSTDNTSQIMADLYAMMSAKLDSVIDKLANSNDTQEKLLMYSRV
jgi:hypothetical protein